MDRKVIENAVKQIILLLVLGDFEELERMKMLGPSTREEYASALQRYLYGQEVLCEQPSEAFSAMEIYETRDPQKWRVDFDLWTEQETERSRSDLTAQIYVEEVSPGIVHSILYDLRVL